MWKKRKEDWWSQRSLMKRAGGWIEPPRRSDILAQMMTRGEAGKLRGGCPATH